MESEKEDILFFFGKSLRTLMRTESDMIQMIVNKFSAFIRFKISEKTLKIPASARIGGMVSKWLKNGAVEASVGEMDPTATLQPLFDYLNENFHALHIYLSPAMNVKVMKETWEIVVDALEGLLLPPLSGKPTSQSPLSMDEKFILSHWIEALEDFFHHGGKGISIEDLESKRFQEFMLGLNRYYDLPTADLIKLSDQQAAQASQRQDSRTFLSVSDQMRRSGTIMAHRNRRALREEQKKLKEAEKQLPGTEDIILRILLLRGEHQFVARRLEQRVHLSKSRNSFRR